MLVKHLRHLFHYCSFQIEGTYETDGWGNFPIMVKYRLEENGHYILDEAICLKDWTPEGDPSEAREAGWTPLHMGDSVGGDDLLTPLGNDEVDKVYAPMKIREEYANAEYCVVGIIKVAYATAVFTWNTQLAIGNEWIPIKVEYTWDGTTLSMGFAVVQKTTAPIVGNGGNPYTPGEHLEFGKNEEFFPLNNDRVQLVRGTLNE